MTGIILTALLLLMLLGFPLLLWDRATRHHRRQRTRVHVEVEVTRHEPGDSDR